MHNALLMHGRGLPLGALFMLVALPAFSQDIHHYRAVVSGLSTTMQEKQLLTNLANSDELGEFSVDRASGDVVLKTVRRLDLFQFEHIVDRCNMHVVSFDEINARPPVIVHSPRVPRLADMPLYMDTGNPVLDDQRYDAYKAAWIAVHPEEYRELTAPQGTPATSENQ